MTRPLVISYAQLESLIRSAGHVYDVGQIDAGVLSQAYGAVKDGVLRVSRDSWPSRGYDGRRTHTVFELARPSKS